MDLEASDFGPVQYHAPPQDYRSTIVAPYGFIEIFGRTRDYDDSHGAARFAVLFLAADGHATYDALFCQGNGLAPPQYMVLQDHGFGGNYSPFGARGLTHRIAKACGAFPEFMLKAESTEIWRGYDRCTDSEGRELQAEGMGPGFRGGNRSLWGRTDAPEPKPSWVG